MDTATMDHTRPGSQPPAGWLEDIARVAWDQLAGESAVDYVLSFLAQRGCPSLFIGPYGPDELPRFCNSDRQIELADDDLTLTSLQRVGERASGRPFWLSAEEVQTRFGGSELEQWLTDRERVLVAPVDASPGIGFLLAEVRQQGIEIAVEFMARQLKLVLSFDHYRYLSAQAEVRLEEAQSRLIALAQLALTDQTVNAVAHQINNCLTSVLGYSQLLLEIGLRTPEENGYIRRVFTEAERMSHALENILNFLRRRNYEPDLVDVNELLQQAVALQVYELEKHEVTVRLQLDADLPITFGDAYKLQVVFINLILNALQAVAETGSPGEILIATKRSSNGEKATIEVEVSDSGPGLKPEIVHSIFDPFFSTQPGRHMGLGLTVARRLIEEHQGHIAVSARPGPGATFTLQFPIRTETRAQASAPRILIVDNEADVLMLLTRLLESRGLVADTACNAEEALKRIEEAEYHCILADLRMPGIGGKALYETVSHNRPELAGRFVFITADNGRPEAAAFLARPGVVWVEKPFDLSEVIQAVQQVLVKSSGGS